MSRSIMDRNSLFSGTWQVSNVHHVKKANEQNAQNASKGNVKAFNIATIKQRLAFLASQLLGDFLLG